MTTIGDLTLNDIGKTRIRTQYEDATIDGIITSLDLEITSDTFYGGSKAVREKIDVKVTIRLGRIELLQLNRDHPCEVIA